MNSNSLKYFLSVVSISALIFLMSCGKAEENKSDQDSKGAEVIAGYPVRKKLTEYINLNATSVYIKQEIVRATFQGYIENTLKNIGDKINSGDILFLIKTKEADAVIGKNELDGKFNGVVKILARTDGVITELNHQTGDYVSDGDQLAVLVDPLSLRIMMDVPFENSNSISINNSLTVQLPNGKTYTARVTKKNPSIDPANQTQKYILQMNRALDLPSNLNVSVKLPIRNYDEAITLPKTSIMSNETQTEFWIMKVLNDSTAVKVDIKKGIETDSLVQIAEPKIGLNDRFIIDGAYGLSDTAKVSIQTSQKKEK
jgi:multidrug efflux pump subunit AcrA (membrane-fusion protein)